MATRQTWCRGVRRWLAAIALAVVAATPARAAPPDTDAAERAYVTGKDLATRGDYRGARAQFERAYAISAQWRYCINVAKTATWAGELVAAERWAWRSLQLASGAVERQKSQQEQDIIVKQLLTEGHALLTVALVGSVSTVVVAVDGEAVEKREDRWPAWVRPGRRIVHVDAQGCAGNQVEVLLTAQEQRSVTCEPCLARAKGPDSTLATTAPADASAASSWGAPAWTAAGGGTLAAVGVAVMGWTASLAADDNAAVRSGAIAESEYATRRSAAQNKYWLGAGCAGAGVLALGAAGWLFWRPSGPKVGLAPQFSVAVDAVALSWVF